MTYVSSVTQRFLRGLKVDTVHEAISCGLRTFDEWRNFLDVEEERKRQMFSTRAKLHHRGDLENLEALRWHLLNFLIVGSPRTHNAMLEEFAGVDDDKLTRTLLALGKAKLIAIKKIAGSNQYHITGKGLCEVEYRETKLNNKPN